VTERETDIQAEEDSDIYIIERERDTEREGERERGKERKDRLTDAHKYR
jgi:hypothetical protein